MARALANAEGLCPLVHLERLRVWQTRTFAVSATEVYLLDEIQKTDFESQTADDDSKSKPLPKG
jgi:hypothetical protein